MTEQSNEDERQFVENCNKYLPVSVSPGVINRICWNIEDAFSTLNVLPDVAFDYNILKSNVEYTDDEYVDIAMLFKDYKDRVQLMMKGKELTESSDSDPELEMLQLKRVFAESCAECCPDAKKLSNIVLDLCYRSNDSKSFVWDVCGEQLFENILNRAEGVMRFPVRDDDGDIVYGGECYSLHAMMVGGYDDCIE